MGEDSILYKIEHLSFSYSLGKQQVDAVRGISLQIPKAKLVTISGPSGSGKSTLLNILGLIEPVQGGKLFFKNEELSRVNEKRKNQIRKYEIGFIFQQFHLFPVLNAEENVKYFLTRQKLSKKEVDERAEEALRAVGLWEHRKKRPSELSGGQKQRVAIARAIAKRPEVIIGDEPTASLDQKTGREIMDLLVQFVEKQKGTVILTTHDPMVRTYSDQNFHLVDGLLEEEEHVVLS